MSSTTATGYGPSSRNLLFNGDGERFEVWVVKFLGHLRLRKLLDVVTAEEPDVGKNAEVFAELVQCLDDRSISLIIRDAKDNGKKSLDTLREHYLGRSKPRIIALYNQLTSLKIGSEETVTDYVIRVETASTSLKSANEVVSDGLLIAMALKGLSAEYTTFSTLVSQKDPPMTFEDFKIALRNFEETEKSRHQGVAPMMDNVMRASGRSDGPISGPGMRCFKCGVLGHKKANCGTKVEKGPGSEGGLNKQQRRFKRWCVNCKSTTHDTSYCRKLSASKSVVSDDSQPHSFAFHVADSDCNGDHIYSQSLLVDCGATSHILCDEEKFVSFDESFNSDAHFIELADGTRTSGSVLGKGDASVLIYDINGKANKVLLKDALCIPSFKQDIFSVQAATENGASINFSPTQAELIAPNGTVFEVTQSGKLYFLNNVKQVATGKHILCEWHHILGHCNKADILKLEKDLEGMIIDSKVDFECETCILGKMSQRRSREADRRASQPLELVHCDLAGPITPEAKEGFKYAVSFVDDFSGAIYVYFIKNKNDTVLVTERFLADTVSYGIVKRFRCDNGTEFSSEEFRSLLVKNKIKQEFSAPYSPHQNGTVERNWRTLFDMSRCLLLDSNLPKSMWTYAVKTAAYIRNRCYNVRTSKTPYELLTGLKPNLSNMHTFGTVCFAYVQNKGKLDPRSEEGIFVGYDSQSPAYLVYFPSKRVVWRVRCVKFTRGFEGADSQIFQDVQPQSGNKISTQLLDKTPGSAFQSQASQDSSEAVPVDKSVDPIQSNEARRYPDRVRSKPKYLNDYICDGDISSNVKCSIDFCYKVGDVPVSYKQAISSANSHEWKIAMGEEMESLQLNNTFELVPPPKDHNVVGGRWVYAIKQGSNNEKKFKARFVAKGYSQMEGIDYVETFSPTARITSIRMLMQFAAAEGLIVDQMDVKTAYLNADIDCTVYVEQPEGYCKTDTNGNKLVCRLNKYLYGLKQSGRNWNTLLHSCLISEKF